MAVKDSKADKVVAGTVVQALDKITGGRIPPHGTPVAHGSHPFIVEKSSGIPGKAIFEKPGLVVGELEKPVASLGIGMTLTESMIELAGAMGLDGIITHHPVADAASSGGVLLKEYLELYDLALFELHEAFHGLHPGIAYLHGHSVMESNIHFAGIPGNVIYRGPVLPGIRIAGDILHRLNRFMDHAIERKILELEAGIRNCGAIREASQEAAAMLMNGSPDSPVSQVLHIFPHTGFNAEHLAMALERFPDTDTVIASISRPLPDSDLLRAICEKGLPLIVGNSHALEIYENGLPMAYALQHELPEVEFFILRERVTATPLKDFGGKPIRQYAALIAEQLNRN